MLVKFEKYSQNSNNQEFNNISRNKKVHEFLKCSLMNNLFMNFKKLTNLKNVHII